LAWNFGAVCSGDAPASAHGLDLSAVLDLGGPYAPAVEDITPGGGDLVHRAVRGYPIHGEHSHLDMFVQFIIEWLPMDGLRFPNVERQDLLYGVSGYDDVDPPHIYSPNLAALFPHFCRHSPLPNMT